MSRYRSPVDQRRQVKLYDEEDFSSKKEYYQTMSRLDEIKSRIDWLKDLFKIVIAIMVANIAGMAALYIDNTISLLFYMGGALLPLLAVSCIVISQKIELHLNELGEL